MFDTKTSSLAETVQRFRRSDRDGWTDVALLDDTKDAIAALREIETAVHLLVARVEAAGLTTSEGGAAGTAAWLERETGVGHTRAQQITRTAKFLNRHSATADALENDRVSLDHVRAIDAVVSTRRHELYDEHETTLLDAAHEIPINDFTKLARRWASLADDQLADSDAITQHQGRRWHYATGMGGTVTTDGFFDPVAGALLIKAVDVLSPPDAADAPGGPRTPAQRRADALTELARRFLANNGHDTDTSMARHEDPTPSAAPKPPVGTTASVSVIVDYETLMGGRPPLDKARCDIEWVGPVVRSTMQRITCDSAMHRIVMNGKSQILDMGRQRRLVTPSQRKALVARDGACIGCHRPASWCEAHHIDGWANGSPTNIDKLVLVCPRCHTLLHEGRWTVQRHRHCGFEMLPEESHPP